MALLKSGSRLKSQVDATELIVVRAPAGEVDLRVGGHPAIDLAATPQDGLVLEAGEPALVGKRYVRAEDDIELLVTKGGQGALTIDGVALHLKESKPLPSSD